MKKYIFLILILLFAVSFFVFKESFIKRVNAVAGSWSQSGNDIFYDSGNVGIGTSNINGLFNVAASSGIGSILSPVMMSEVYDGDGEFSRMQEPRDSVVVGNYAYVLSYYEDSMTIIDISNPSDPVKISEVYDGDGEFSRLDGATSIAISGNYAYVASLIDSALTIIDISNPSDPVKISEVYDGDGEFSRLQWALDVFISGNYAYVVSSYDKSLTIMDVSTPSNPILKSEVWYSSEDPKKVFVSGNYAYLANGNDTFKIYDVSDPTSQVFKSSISDGNGTFNYLHDMEDVIVKDSYAYVLSGDDDGLTIINVSNPLSMSKVSEIREGGNSIFISGDYAYIGEPEGVKFIDISNLSSPSKVSAVADGTGGFSRLSQSKSIYNQGNYTYVLGSSDQSFVIMKTDSIADVDAFTITESGSIGINSSSPSATLDIQGYMRLKKYSSAPVSCTTQYDGAISLNSSYKGCVCKAGTGWVLLSDGSTTCTW